MVANDAMNDTRGVPTRSPGRTVAIVQARMGSTRLPGKVLRDLDGVPMLGRALQRASQSQRVDQVVVATSTHPGDDEIEAFCSSQDYSVFRGSESDVLDRYYQAAKHHGADIVVRITADCPLIDPELIDEVIHAHAQHGADFTANRLPPPWHRTYPKGVDVEVCSFEALATAWRHAELPYEREHVMPYLYVQEGRFRVHVLEHEPDYGHVRFSVDEPADLAVVRAIYRQLRGRERFSWYDVMDVLLKDPDLSNSNASVRQKTLYED